MAPATDATALLLSCFQKALGHELPNMLVAAQGTARFLAAEVPAEQKAALEHLAELIQKADSLVRRLAQLGRMLREPPHREAVNLEELVHEAAVEVRMTKGLPRANLKLAADLPTLVTDRERLRQVLLQVLRNAHQAARAEHSLTIRVEWDKEAHALRLIDNGRGLPPRPLDSLLQPFHPANCDQHGERSQGLGLFTAQVLLSSLGGTLTLSSGPTGTTVEIRFSGAGVAPDDSPGKKA
jgi:signal transduction histidine kinase